MSVTLNQMNAIRQKQGLPPIDGTRIIDDPHAAAPYVEPPPLQEPWPTDPPPELFQEREDLPGDPIDPNPEPTPLGEGLSPVGAMDLAELLAQKELVVMDRSAMFRQRSVQLNDPEWTAVVQVVLKAVRRSLDEQYAEVAGVKPRVRKKGAAASGGSFAAAPADAAPAQSAPVKKRRGRPPKQRMRFDGGPHHETTP